MLFRSYALADGETLGVVGESGSGKSVHVLAMLGLIPRPPGRIARGQVLFAGRDLLALGEAELRDVRGGQIGFIFQDPMTSLNPVLTVGRQIAEPIVRLLPSVRDSPSCSMIVSVIWRPIVNTGLSDVIGSWNTIEMSLPRMARIARSERVSRFLPSKRI